MINKFFPKRRVTREVIAGGVGIGEKNPIRVQTMTNTDTLDIKATVAQIVKLKKHGAELVRLSAQTIKHAEAIGRIKEILIKKNLNLPLIADVHYSDIVAKSALKFADKVRINPGNLLNVKIGKKKIAEKEFLKIAEDTIYSLTEEAKKYKVPFRIGVNSGSLSPFVNKSVEKEIQLAKSAVDFLKIFKKFAFNNLIVSIKSSNPLEMIAANRLLVKFMAEEKMDYPIHLGVTEAGNLLEGRVKSIIGIATLLLDGIGDTIRASLTENPLKEIELCQEILQSLGQRTFSADFVSCPGCGRTLFDIEKVATNLKKNFKYLTGLKIAVMGCGVNGFGEIKDADYAFMGGKKGLLDLYHRNELIKKNIPEGKAVFELSALLKKHGKLKFSN